MGQITVPDETLAKLHALAAQQGKSLEGLLDTFVAEQELTPLGLLELAADAVVMINADQLIVHVNAGAQDMFGYPAAVLVGQPLALLLPSHISTTHQAHVAAFGRSPAISRHMGHRMNVQGRREDGELFPAQVSIFKYYEGGQLYYVAIVRDISEQEQAQTELRDREHLLKLLFDNVTDLICLHEPDGRYLYVSSACRQIGGYEPEELIGTNPYAHFHPDDLNAIRASHQTSLGGQEVRGTIYRFRRKDSSYIWLETMTTPITSEAGEIINLVTVSRDITHQRLIEEELRQERDLLTRIMETSPSGITVVDHTGQIIFVNKRAEEIQGAKRDEVTQRSYDSPVWKHTDYEGNLWPDEQQPFVRVMQTKAAVWDVRHAIEWSDGHKVYLVINGAPILDEQGEVSKVVFTIEDYTERKLQQDALEAALERERQLNEMKTAFISMVAHEFRTPMSVIMNSTGLLRMKHTILTSEELLMRLRTIDAQIRHLDQLLADITFINKADVVGHLIQPEWVHLPAFFQQIAEQLQLTYRDHPPVELMNLGTLETVFCDPILMQQIFLNLLSNAVKYSPPERPAVCRYRLNGEQLEAWVIDEGIGIPPEEHPLLFQPFQRASNVGSRQGTGLGLAITRRAVDALGGSISFESEPGRGSTFAVVLPVKTEEAASA